MKRRQIAQIVKRNMNGSFPMGWGFGDSFGSRDESTRVNKAQSSTYNCMSSPPVGAMIESYKYFFQGSIVISFESRETE